jgi:probable HAF family extracellular repeat protein
MKSVAVMWIAVMTLAALALPVQAMGQPAQHRRYKLIDLGTLGGRNSTSGAFSGGGAQLINNQGKATATADTSLLDPDYPNFNPNVQGGPYSYVFRPILWNEGQVTALEALGGDVDSAAAGWISGSGLIAGISEMGVIDPLTGWPEAHATLWKRGQAIDLGTLGGYESFAYGLNNHGEAVGGATNTTPDELYGFGTQLRAFVFRDGEMHDLGTLGGPDAFATSINDQNQISGCSLNDDLSNLPFLWQNGKMIELGTFGGTNGCAFLVNNHGQVIGQSDLSGDKVAHGFFWERGVFTDLGNFGGNVVEPFWVNNAGEVVGGADYPGNTVRRAFLWKRGVLKDLGTVFPNCASEFNGSVAISINSKSQVVGNSWCDNSDFAAFLWEKGAPMVNLNELVHPSASLQMVAASSINDRGEILGTAFVPETGNLHAAVLIPCDQQTTMCGTETDSVEATARSSGVVFRTSVSISHLQITNPRHRLMLGTLKSRKEP